MRRSAPETVVVPRVDGILLVNRSTLQAVTLPSEAEPELRAQISRRPDGTPTWITDALSQVGLELAPGQPLTDLIHMRERPALDYLRTTWEITERCNYRCIHCYLGEKTRHGLGMAERLRVLDKLERAGCLWLQLTGGEALADPLFEETYRAAWNRGMMVSVLTNGHFLARWIDLFRALPPRRVTMSLYGWSGATYAAMTGAQPQAFDAVATGFEAARSAGIRLRVSVVAAKPNAHEVEHIEAKLREWGVEHHTYWQLSPTVQGSAHPMQLSADLGRVPTYFGQAAHKCIGGTHSLHVHVSGRAGPCKLLPHISVDMLTKDIDILPRLANHPGTRAPTASCQSCSLFGRCTTCAPVFALHLNAGGVPPRVCVRDERRGITAKRNAA